MIHVVHGLSVGRLTSDVKYCIKMKIETGSISKGKNLTKEVKLLKTTNGSGSSTQLDNPAPEGGIQLVYPVQGEEKLTIRTTSSCNRHWPG